MRGGCITPLAEYQLIFLINPRVRNIRKAGFFNKATIGL